MGRDLGRQVRKSRLQAQLGSEAGRRGLLAVYLGRSGQGAGPGLQLWAELLGGLVGEWGRKGRGDDLKKVPVQQQLTRKSQVRVTLPRHPHPPPPRPPLYCLSREPQDRE